MKALIKTIILLLIFKVNSFGQCTFVEIFPFAMGSTKFVTTIQVSKFSHLEQSHVRNTDPVLSDKPRYELATNESINFYRGEYLINDSIRINRLYYDLKYSPCFLVNNGSMRLSFADDRLYAVIYDLTFPSIQNRVCVENYERLKSLVKGSFPFVVEFPLTRDEVQIGWSAEFYKNEKDYGSDKPEFIDIEMMKGYYSDAYELEVKYFNLKGTKFNRNKGLSY